MTIETMVALIFGMGIFLAIIAIMLTIALYVLGSLSIQKILVRQGYTDWWMAWIPGVRQYALADVALDGISEVYLFNKAFSSTIVKFWWIITYLLTAIPRVGGYLAIIVRIFVLGKILTYEYMKLDNRAEADVKPLAYVSAAFPIVAYIKFLLS